MNEWANFFSAMAESAATLTGLIFVGVSINLAKILSFPSLTDRALESLILLLNILLISAMALIPNQAAETTGIKIISIDTITWAFILFLDVRIWRNTLKPDRRRALQNTIFSHMAVLPYIVGGVMLICNGYSGLYWIIPAITISFVKAVIDAWVILVEIHR